MKKDGLLSNNTFDGIGHENKYGKIAIRPILFAIEETDRLKEKLWINGDDIRKFIWECFCPIEKRSDCSTRYDFNLWGSEYMDIVKFFKDRDKTGQGLPELNELYDALVGK